VTGQNEPQLVIWPHGFRAQLTDDGANLLDAHGRVVAHTGDEVRGAGGLAMIAGREGFTPCLSELEFLPANP
jgi:hypothetical protein